MLPSVLLAAALATLPYRPGSGARISLAGPDGRTFTTTVYADTERADRFWYDPYEVRVARRTEGGASRMLLGFEPGEDSVTFRAVIGPAYSEWALVELRKQIVSIGLTPVIDASDPGESWRGVTLAAVPDSIVGISLRQLIQDDRRLVIAGGTRALDAGVEVSASLTYEEAAAIIESISGGRTAIAGSVQLESGRSLPLLLALGFGAAEFPMEVSALGSSVSLRNPSEHDLVVTSAACESRSGARRPISALERTTIGHGLERRAPAVCRPPARVLVEWRPEYRFEEVLSEYVHQMAEGGPVLAKVTIDPALLRSTGLRGPLASIGVEVRIRDRLGLTATRSRAISIDAPADPVVLTVPRLADTAEASVRLTLTGPGTDHRQVLTDWLALPDQYGATPAFDVLVMDLLLRALRCDGGSPWRNSATAPKTVIHRCLSVVPVAGEGTGDYELRAGSERAVVSFRLRPMGGALPPGARAAQLRAADLTVWSGGKRLAVLDDLPAASDGTVRIDIVETGDGAETLRNLFSARSERRGIAVTGTLKWNLVPGEERSPMVALPFW